MNKICIRLFSIILIMCVITNANMVFAVTQSDINKQKNEQSQVSEQIEDIKEQKEEVEAKKSEAQKQVEKLNNQIDSYENEIDKLEIQIDDANKKIKDAEKQLKENQEQYDEQQKLLEQRLVATYEAGETSFLDVILNSNGLVDMISNYYLVSEIVEHDTELLDEIEAKKQEIEKSKKEIEDSKKTLVTAKASKESVATQLKSTQQEKSKYVNELTQEEANLEKELKELKNHESSISSKIKSMQAAYDAELAAKKKAEEAAKNTSKSSSNSSSSSGGSSSNKAASSYGFGWPVANPVIGTGYGVAGRYWSSGHHTGVDFRASTGTPIYSIGDGIVCDTGYNSAYGNFVEIYHGNSIYSFYAHASRVQVSFGQKISKGQQIMLSGATGNVTGPHLHFEIRTPGSAYRNCVNPRPYLP
ncbi:MAG TPA: hypothetical protein DEP51_03310 [Clostridiales bacterium]|nr:hypothetical protein [Clostridiales bacterium]